MKFVTRFFAVLLALVFTTSAWAQNNTLNNVELKTLTNEKVNLEDYIKENVEEGTVTFISFWATWCSPCKKELDNLMDIVPEWEDAGYKVEIIAVSVDNSRTTTKVAPMVEAKGWGDYYTVLCDPNNDSYQKLSFQSVPQSFLVDQEGNLVYSHSGYTDGDEVELEDKIIELFEH